MDARLKILLLEDLPSDADLIKREIKNSGFDILSLVVETKKEYIKALKELILILFFPIIPYPLSMEKQALLIRGELAHIYLLYL